MYTLLNGDKLWCTTELIYVDNGQYYTVSWQTPDKAVRPSRHQHQVVLTG